MLRQGWTGCGKGFVMHILYVVHIHVAEGRPLGAMWRGIVSGELDSSVLLRASSIALGSQ